MAHWKISNDKVLAQLYPSMTLIELSQYFGVSDSTIKNNLRRLKLCSKKERPIDQEDLLERLMLNQSLSQIADELGCSRRRVKHHAKKLGNAYRNNMIRRGYPP